MKCRFTKHALLMMSKRGINKQTVLNVIHCHENKWLSKKCSRNEMYSLDLITVVRNKHNGCILTVYRYGEVEEWHK